MSNKSGVSRQMSNCPKILTKSLRGITQVNRRIRRRRPARLSTRPTRALLRSRRCIPNVTAAVARLLPFQVVKMILVGAQRVGNALHTFQNS